MEKQKPPQSLTPQEWESLIESFHVGKPLPSSLSLSSLLPLSLSSILSKSFPLSLKTHLLLFLPDLAASSPADAGADDLLGKLIDALKTLIQSPIDNLSITYALKDQFLVSATSFLISIAAGGGGECWRHVEGLVGILLAIINRPNHGIDRQTRAVACECLRELEAEFPGLLAEIVGHLWGICQNERTHACQSYILLLLDVVTHIVEFRLSVGSVFSTAVPLVPFNVPSWVGNGSGYGAVVGEEELGELPETILKEMKRVMAFLLEWPQVLTPCGMVEFMSRVMPLAVGLDLQHSLLKVQFGGLLYNYDPLLWHVVLMLSRWFPDMFDGQEAEICKRLVLISKEGQQHLVFRLLVLHWLLGFVGLVSEKDVVKRKLIGGMESSFYPNVFDALALKSLKLDLLAFCSIVSSQDCGGGSGGQPVVKCLEDGLVCVSAFKWLPAWSTETAVAVRTLHKFLIGASPHSNTDLSVIKVIMNSSIFRTVQTMLVTLQLDYHKLVPVVVTLIDRLVSCDKHYWLGQKLLQTVDQLLLPKLDISYRLSAYFLMFDKIGKNDTIPPLRLLDLLAKYSLFLVEKHSADTGLYSWSQGSKVLGVCRTMLLHHPSSRLFMGLSQLLAFISLYFPDLEVRDNARIYLRMLICIPGKKLRHVLNFGDQSIGLSPSPHASSLFSAQSPRLSEDLKKSRNISSYIHVERVIPLLVKQSWSLSLPALGFDVGKGGFVGIEDVEPLVNDNHTDRDNATEFSGDFKRLDQPQEPLRVMDSKIAVIVNLLRKHFSCIPDFRHMTGLKIRIPCTLRFQSESFKRIWGSDLPQLAAEELDSRPAMYGIVLKFSSSAPYGCIPSYHIPFLVGETSSSQIVPSKASTAIVPVGTLSSEESGSRSSVTIELEPREPVPGLVDISLDANAGSGQVIRGKLQGVSVGIEDMFLNTPVPPEIPDDAIPEYCSCLFNALWEACGASSNSGRETFSLKGGKGVAAIYGTQSVKLLEVPSTFAIHVVERSLAPFVVSVIGEPLVEVVKDGRFIRNVTWTDAVSNSVDASNKVADSGHQLFLTYTDNEVKEEGMMNIGKTSMGCFLVLIFLPPRYHLLFQMEVSENSTLVRIRTDHWPCLAYVDEYLEALFSS